MRSLNKNIVKKSLVVLLVFICYIFASCSNSLDSTPSATGSYSVTGKISFAGSSGAAPLILTKNSEGRTATTSFNNAHFSLNLYAYKYGQDGLDQSKKYDNVVVDQSGSFIFCFESKGEYVIYAELIKDEKTCGKGSAYVEVNSFTPKSVRINASPVITENGTIQLSVSTATDITPTIKKVCVNWIDIYSRNIEDEATHDGTGHESSPAMQIMNSVLTEGEYNKSFDLVNGTATISYDDFPGGSWLAKINFDDDIGNTIYSCQEIINVYPGFITNLWYGTTPAIADGNFKVTKNMVTKYGTEVVPNFDNILLWNHSEWYDEDRMNGTFYYLTNENSIENFVATGVPDTIEDPEEYEETGAAVYSKFGEEADMTFEDTFFDADGNIYLVINSDNPPSPGNGIISNRSDWNYVDWENLDFSNEMGCGFTVDLKTNIVYSMEWNGYIYIRKYADLISSKGTQYAHATSPIDLENPIDFCVYNNIAYILREVSDGKYEITSFDMNSTVSPNPIIKTISFDLNNVIGSGRQSYARVNSMLYQDGAIYMLYKEGASSLTSRMYSRGAVIRVSLLDGNVTTTGLTSNYLERDNIQLQGFSDSMNPMYEDENCQRPMVLSLTEDQKSSRYPEYIYFPAEGENCFYGPSKFVAVKPKKLVIADEGMAFYTDNDILYYKNVNRIVYVDLENFANGISEEYSLDSSVTLSTDKKDIFYSSMIEGDNIDYYTEGFENMQGTISYYVGIPCGDN